MKKLIVIVLLLSFFFLLIYASSEPARDINLKKKPIDDFFLTSPRLGRLRACSEDEFNCNILGQDYTQCVKKFKICDHQIECSNGDQLECPLCDHNFIYCDQSTNMNKCVELEHLCSDRNQQSRCSSNQTNIDHECEKFKSLSLNTHTTPDPTIDSSTSSMTENVTFAEEISSTILITTPETTSSTDYSISSTTFDSIDFENDSIISTTTEASITSEQSLTTTPTHLSTTTQLSDSTKNTTDHPSTRTTNSSTNQTIESVTKRHSFTGPRNIMDYSKMFKHDYGAFNFSNYIYKGNKKGGKFDWNSFAGGQTGGNKSTSSFFDYSKFMNGGNGGFDYSKFMGGSGGNGGGYDYSQYFGGGQAKKEDNINLKATGQNTQSSSNENNGDYSKYMSQYTGQQGGYDYSKYLNGGSKTNNSTNNETNSKGQSYDYSKYMSNGNGYDYSQYTGQNAAKQDNKTGQVSGSSDYSTYMNAGYDKDNKSKEWGVGSYDYSRYKQSGLNSKNSKGFKYQNDVKSGQKNQDKYAKDHYDYSNYMHQDANQANKNGTYDSYYNSYLQGNSTNYQNYSKYTDQQQGSSKVNGKETAINNTKSITNDKNNSQEPAQNPGDYSKYMSQYTQSGGQGFDYSKYMKGSNGGGYFDFSKYMSGQQGGGQKEPNLKGAKGDDLINLTGSKQPTKSFTNWFDYSKYLKPGGHQSDVSDNKKQPVRAQQLKTRKKPAHQAHYLHGFKERFVKLQEERQNEIHAQNLARMNGKAEQSGETETEPILKKSSDQSVGKLQYDESAVQFDSENKQNLKADQIDEGYHHIEMQNQRPKFNKQPAVNVSKIIPNMMSNSYNYTHYGSGVFFINFGTIVNGNNNINGDGNDVGNGNGNGNNNGNTQGDNMRGYDLNAGSSKSSSPKPISETGEDDQNIQST